MEGHHKLLLQMANESPEGRHQAMEKWNGEYAAELDEQRQLAIRMGEESQPPLLPVPTAPRIPNNASPELREFLTGRHELMIGRAELSNQLRTATPEQRHLAMEEWNEKNASRLDALRIASTRLSSSQPQRHGPTAPKP